MRQDLESDEVQEELDNLAKLNCSFFGGANNE